MLLYVSSEASVCVCNCVCEWVQSCGGLHWHWVFFLVTLHLVYWGWLSKLNPELGNLLSLASQLARGPVSTFWVLGLQTSCHSRPALYESYLQFTELRLGSHELHALSHLPSPFTFKDSFCHWNQSSLIAQTGLSAASQTSSCLYLASTETACVSHTTQFLKGAGFELRSSGLCGKHFFSLTISLAPEIFEQRLLKQRTTQPCEQTRDHRTPTAGPCLA